MKIEQGELFVVGKKLMVQCPICKKIIRIDKPILGSLHICLTDEEISVASMKFRQKVDARLCEIEGILNA
ncbi:hypothetical protein LCGC14_0361950 [marine sediment metagenome]|uniref:Uncharacterized protein n=1 Tax=marine sediment metagenome TaxID=412755 RepID=A0A0F9TQI2_9ZZZZ